MLEIKIISEPSEEKPFLVIYKPSGLPSAPLAADDTDNAFSKAAELFPVLLQVHGKKEIEHGLLHRLDTVTEGLLIIAATQNFYDYLISQQSGNKFYKYYKAVCNIKKSDSDGFPEFPFNYSLAAGNRFSVESYFRPYGTKGSEVRPVLENSSKIALKKVGKLKLYNTEVSIIKADENQVEVECCITQGFRHQIRCHLAWCGLPIIGDEVYNSVIDGQIKFRATKIKFKYNDKDFVFEID